jgi:hypothetical protein
MFGRNLKERTVSVSRVTVTNTQKYAASCITKLQPINHSPMKRMDSSHN